MNLLIEILINAVALFVGAKLLSGVTMKNFTQAVIVAIVIAILNATLGMALKIVTLGLLSLGVFTLLLDAILIQVADFLLGGFKVKSFWWALGLGLIVAIVNSIFKGII
jgi:putative membrane protein